jgi:hypothetical protein
MTTTNPYTTDPATENQIRFVERLGGDALHAHKLSKRDASRYIDDLKANPVSSATSSVSVTDPGVYEHDGVVYIVKPNRAKTGLYAKRIREIGGTRVTAAGTFVAVEFEYAAGVVFNLSPEDRMTGQRAKELTIRYGKCICCGRDLRAGESVEQGIGPVCVRSFPDLVAERVEIKARAKAEAKRSREIVANYAAADLAPIAGGAPSLVEMATRIEGKPRVETRVEVDLANFQAIADDFRRDQALVVAQPTIDERAEKARELICGALACLRLEFGIPVEDCDEALATFDVLLDGFER